MKYGSRSGHAPFLTRLLCLLCLLGTPMRAEAFGFPIFWRSLSKLGFRWRGKASVEQRQESTTLELVRKISAWPRLLIASRPFVELPAGVAVLHSLVVSDTYMVNGWGVKAFNGRPGDTPYNYPGPCLLLSRHSIPASEVFSGNRMGLVVTTPAECIKHSGPSPVVLMFNGYQVQLKYYRSVADRLASWGYAVIQYDRPANGLSTPPNELETAFASRVLGWAAAASSSEDHLLHGTMDTSRVGLVGHSMGGALASIVAAEHPEQVQGVVLLDPVDFTQLSDRLARSFLLRFKQPVAILKAGVRCLDRNGCGPPLDHLPQEADEKLGGSCLPSWECCHWDDGEPGLEEEQPRAQLALPTDGPSGFAEFAAPGSWVVTLKRAGHMAFLDFDPITHPGFSIDCPLLSPPSEVVPDVLPFVTGWMEHAIRGAEVGSMAQWAAMAARDRIELVVKPAADSVKAV